MDHHREAQRLSAARLGTTLTTEVLMTAAIIDGRKQAQILLDDIASQLTHLSRPPGLAVVIVGDDPASHMYVRNKARTAQRLGLHSETVSLSADATEPELLSAIALLNDRDAIDGILVQLRVPHH